MTGATEVSKNMAVTDLYAESGTISHLRTMTGGIPETDPETIAPEVTLGAGTTPTTAQGLT
jgi:hypothetical protein